MSPLQHFTTYLKWKEFKVILNQVGKEFLLDFCLKDPTESEKKKSHQPDYSDSFQVSDLKRLCPGEL